jgi:hypothetical protein
MYLHVSYKGVIIVSYLYSEYYSNTSNYHPINILKFGNVSNASKIFLDKNWTHLEC